jgi:cardiolipin synthase (CMP-forming)
LRLIGCRANRSVSSKSIVGCFLVSGSLRCRQTNLCQSENFRSFSIAKLLRNDTKGDNKKVLGKDTEERSNKDANQVPGPASPTLKIIDSLSKVRSGALTKENIYTVPNILTFSRLAASPIIGYLLVNDQPFWALTLVVYSGVTDLLDGYIARRYNLQTVVGSVIDPMADKALMITLASCLCISGNIPVYMAALILGRDILLALSAVYYRYVSLPPPKTFMRYWDFSIPSAEVHPTTISKYNTFLQMTYLGLSLLFPVLRDSFTPDTVTYLWHGLKGLEYITAGTTIASGLSYVFSKDAVKILRN